MDIALDLERLDRLERLQRLLADGRHANIHCLIVKRKGMHVLAKERVAVLHYQRLTHRQRDDMRSIDTAYLIQHARRG